MNGAEAQSSDQLAPLLAQYTRAPGVADELFDSTGQMRAVWRPFITELAKLSPEMIEQRFARGDRYLNDTGVYFRQYSNNPMQDRAWPLSHIPVLLHEAEWQGICTGLTQRANVLERVVADLYGDMSLVQRGHLPAALVAGNPQWLRPLVGIAPRSGHHLHFLAFELGRSPDGSWLVLGDRTQAPSGSGFALENRMATTRVFSDPFPRANIKRLAGFFRAFRAAMEDLNNPGAGRTAILTPGPSNDTYYEQTYIARYLGLMLLEGEDLIVQNGRVVVSTVDGLQPIDVIWRRLDSSFADALELDETSQIGTPGMVEAVRNGSVSMVNGLGAGVLEARAMMAFLPKISEILTDEKLILPNIATWWCGQPSERSYVKKNADRMMIGEALSRDLPFEIGATTALGGRFRGAARESISMWIDEEGEKLVGQEAVTLSTTPAYDNGFLVPRPMTIRVFAARTDEGWVFMPGGYARIGRSGDATALAMQRGGSVADVWIVGDSPAKIETLLGDDLLHRTEGGALPSRAADNLFWLGRYVERTESVIRLLRAYHLRLAETGDPSDPRLKLLAEHLKDVAVDVADPLPSALLDSLSAAQFCAGKVRDRFSVDGWHALTDLAKTAREMSTTVAPGDDAARAMSVLLRKINGFAGLVHDNMYRFVGWRFLSFGRALERADSMSSVLARFANPKAVPGGYEIAVEYGDSVMTHQRRYRIEVNRVSAIDLLCLDADNPRSVHFQIKTMLDVIEALPRARKGGRPSDLLRALMLLDTELAVATPKDMTTERLAGMRGILAEIGTLLSSSYLR